MWRSSEPLSIPSEDVMRRDYVMKTKFSRVPALAVILTVPLAAGLVSAAGSDDDSAITNLMAQVNTRNRAIGKQLRTRSALEAAGRKELAADAAFLVGLGKEARTLTGPARERRRLQREWTLAVDDFLRSSEEFARVIADPGSSRPQATRFYQKLQKTCTHCHSTFREEAD
jgi:hypothetical protein